MRPLTIPEAVHRVRMAAKHDGCASLELATCCSHVLAMTTATINPATGEEYADNDLDRAKRAARLLEGGAP